MKYIKLEIPELILCEPTIHQDNTSFNKYGVIRGLHTNTLNFAQSKLVSVLDGKILDVAVDFRVGSPTFVKAISLELSCENNKQLFIPRGFLHGFSVLSQNALVMIKIDSYLANGQSIGVSYSDDKLNIDWKIPKISEILSDGDKNLKKFEEVNSPFIYGKNYY